ncbi:MAG: DUF3631 domain-containing protein [Geminicoccaceae bacterium]
MDRSIVIEMHRRRADEKIQRLRIDRTPDLDELAVKAASWTADHVERLADADPDAPAALNDRAADNWRLLLAVADAADGDWPTSAREAALALTDKQADDSIGVLLLQDIRSTFDERGADRLPSNDLTSALVALQDRPWSEWKKGKPLTANALSRLLEPFSIVPGSIRIGTSSEAHRRATSASNSRMRGPAMPPAWPIAPFKPLQRHIPVNPRLSAKIKPPQATRCGGSKMARTLKNLQLVALWRIEARKRRTKEAIGVSLGDCEG